MLLERLLWDCWPPHHSVLLPMKAVAASPCPCPAGGVEVGVASSVGAASLMPAVARVVQLTRGHFQSQAYGNF